MVSCFLLLDTLTFDQHILFLPEATIVNVKT